MKLRVLSHIFPVCFLAACSQGVNFTPVANDSLTIRQQVAADLKDVRQDGYPTRVEKIRAAFAALDRRATVTTAASMVELKYLLAHYRETVRALLVQRAVQCSPDTLERVIEALASLKTFIPAADCAALWKSSQELGHHAHALTELLAEYGDATWAQKNLPGDIRPPTETAVYTGPGAHKQFGNSGWLGKKEFSLEKYHALSEFSVRIRGIEIRSGDVLVLDQGATSGVNTNFSLQRSYATHCGLVVFLKKNNVTYPAYFEIAERGLRVIPLSSAVDPSFLLYGEVLRPKALAEMAIVVFNDWADKFSADVQARLPLRYFYDYYAPKIVDGQELGVVCSSQVQLFLKRAGITIAAPADEIHPLAQASLATQLAYPLKEYVTPTSLLRGGDLAFVGFLDTGRFVENVTRELMIGGPDEAAPESLAYLFSHRPFDLAKVKKSPSGAYFSAIRLAAPIAIMAGEANVDAPTDVLALAKTLGEALEIAHAELLKPMPSALAKNAAYGFSLGEFAHHPDVRALVKLALQPVADWFGEAAPVPATK